MGGGRSANLFRAVTLPDFQNHQNISYLLNITIILEMRWLR